jgi:hypothetical protein
MKWMLLVATVSLADKSKVDYRLKLGFKGKLISSELTLNDQRYTTYYSSF